MSKALKITDGAYNELKKVKDEIAEKYKKQGRESLSLAITAMGLGSFAGFLIFKGIKWLESDEPFPESSEKFLKEEYGGDRRGN